MQARLSVTDPDLELWRGEGGRGFALPVLPAFLPSVIYFLPSLPKIRSEGVGGGRRLSVRKIEMIVNDDSKASLLHSLRDLNDDDETS